MDQLSSIESGLLPRGDVYFRGEGFSSTRRFNARPNAEAIGDNNQVALEDGRRNGPTGRPYCPRPPKLLKRHDCWSRESGFCGGFSHASLTHGIHFASVNVNNLFDRRHKYSRSMTQKGGPVGCVSEGRTEKPDWGEYRFLKYENPTI